MKLEAKLVELNRNNYADGVSTVWGIDDKLILELATDGWQMTTTIRLDRLGRANIVLGLFYRKAVDTPPATATVPLDTMAPPPRKPKEKNFNA